MKVFLMLGYVGAAAGLTIVARHFPEWVAFPICWALMLGAWGQSLWAQAPRLPSRKDRMRALNEERRELIESLDRPRGTGRGKL